MRKLLLFLVLLLVPLELKAQTSFTAGGNIYSANASCVVNSCVPILLPGDAAVLTVGVTGTWSGTLQVEQSQDGGVTWTSAGAALTANGTTVYAVGAFSNFRVRASAWTSGNAGVNLLASIAPSGGVTSGSTNPTGTCSPNQIYINNTGATLFFCANGTWVQAGSGTGTVTGTGTANSVTKWSGASTVANSTGIDDGTNPTQWPNGVSTESQGNYDLWTVDTGGVTAGLLACVTSNRKVQTCSAGAVNNVAGVAQATVSSGGTVRLCWAAHCNVTAHNNTVTNDWLIPSATTGGQVDDTGSSTVEPPNTQAFRADSTVTAGSLVSITVLSPSEAGANINPAKITTVEVNGVQSASIANFNNSTPAAAAGFGNVNFAMSTAAGVSSISGNFSQAIPVNPQTTSPYTFNCLTDRISLLKPNSASPFTVNIPQAGTGNCVNNVSGAIYNAGTAAVSLVPATSTINGAASVSVPAGGYALLWSDNTNYFAGLSASSGYSTIQNSGSSITQRSILNFKSSGSASMNCADNSGAGSSDCTVTGVNGPPSPLVNYIGSAAYTIQNSDQTYRDTAQGPTTAITLPQANTIGVSPFIGTKFSNALASCSACSSTTFSQSSGDALYLSFMWTNTTPLTVVSVGDTAGDIFVRQAPDQLNIGTDHLNITQWVAKSISASASNTVTVTLSGTVGGAGAGVVLRVLEYNILLTDNASSASKTSSTTSTNLNTTINVSYSQEVAVASYATGTAAGCPTGWTSRGSNLSNLFMVTCERLLSSQASVNFQIPDPNSENEQALSLTGYQIPSQPLFTAGWYNVISNDNAAAGGGTGNGNATVTPTTSTVNGRTTLVIVPNEWCAPMSDGINNYNVICGFIPNQLVNGVIGSPIEIGSNITNNTSADVTTTTLAAVGSADAFFKVDADVTCRAAIAGTETLTITFTDTSNTVQTYTTSGVCTALGASSMGSIVQAFRAKSGTNITMATSHTGSQPTYDVAVALFEVHTL